MAQVSVVEITVTREECWSALAEQQRNDLVVMHAAATDVKTNLVDRYPPMLEKLPLIGGNILIEDVHAGKGSTVNSSTWRCSA